MGTAGTGKSYLINAIRGRLYEIAKKHNLHENNMVVAPTGVAAFNVEGSTIHSSLSVPICGRSIILIGDFGQLPPACDVPMYSQDSRDHMVVVPIVTSRNL
ncbi:ATP-dependent DNA helicase PIF1-like [Rhizophagus irregularis DAOM 181602=DAOM 197198]|uniref:ATP-dependent DNA helicase n=1 Tax=Rhizophagus irregularis (strain DAOM 197198w) TaxID=1432141 RepID=A0A015L4S7_RHIIW|nr:hypothetical protein RirG_048530 [Rhizophagus irregularis DAOM 197198w]GET50018.1 ATP-dependent DNA helicase PIF1-like [Rhizophagus irregularis DAOM 181602=DAOM 197198]